MDRTWLDLLECPSCRGDLEPTPDDSIRCRRCPLTFNQQDGVYDFLKDAHPVVRRELAAIRAQDSADPRFMATFASWLKRLDAGDDDFLPEHASSPFLKNALLHRNQIRQLIGRHPLKTGSVLVELGADHCWASGMFIDRGARVIAVDISDHLAMAPRKSSGALLRLKADMNCLPLRNGSADYAFANACAHHSWDLKKTFSEAYRVLRPGGRLFLCSEPMPRLFRYLLFTLLGSFGKDERRAGINETLHRRSSWTRIARSAGFNTSLVLPDFSTSEITGKLRDRHLPEFMRAGIAPFLGFLRVSIHMVADKPRGANSSGL